MKKQEVINKVEYYAKEITNKKPTFDTVFRIYFDSLKAISKILYYVRENPWHPDCDYAEEIFGYIDELFEELEKNRLKSINNE